jgi:sugar lactone lactonase YvrE
MALPSMPTGVVLTDDARLVVALDDGLHLIDPDVEHSERIAAYPAGLGDRANDAAADLDGNLVTGTLNLVPADGSYWWWSASSGWRQLDDDISNANGPAIINRDGQHTLVFADTPAAVLYAYDYDGRNGCASNRRVFADTRKQDGVPDGSAVDADGGVWSCMLNAGTIVRYGPDGTTATVDATVDLPSDVTFGGPDLDQLFFVSIAVRFEDYTPITSGPAGRLMVVDDLGYRGRPEPRLHL